ncbi:MAG: glycosyltransferase family 2 protein [Nanoarchaeota archaeon]
MDKPTASIIITTYNRAQLLTERSLKSALDQTYKDYEIIVVDDAGEDNTSVVINQYAQVQYYKFLQNQGLSAARNFGIKQAKGEYVVCLDDDNVLMPEFLEETIKEISKNKETMAIPVGRIIKYKNFEEYAKPYQGLMKFNPIDWGWLIRKEVFDYIQYDEKLRANEDADFGIQFGKRFFSVSIIDKPLTIAFDTDDPESSLSFPNERELQGILYFLEKNLHEYKYYPDELRCLYRLAGRKFYRGGYKMKGLNYFWKSFLAKPCFNSFANLFFILFGWFIYNHFMTITERVRAKYV